MIYPLEVAQQHLSAWLAADLAVSTGQSYQIGTRSLTRAHISEIRKQIAYWEGQVRASTTGRRGARVMRVVPRDL